ncbi:MAG: thioredoxin domain-containing protein [Acidimicrobiia bacterium]
MNRLATETSPYLRQHADNPVDWYPWGAEAFAEARDLDRPVLLSVGYSACHWCHVMAHESFEDPATATVMNDLFVNVKVDREERPDVDAIYMDATQAMTGQGGWPMTVFMSPDGRPFYCGTYFPKVRRGGMPAFVEVLRAIDEAWGTRREHLMDHAGKVLDAISRTALLADGPGEDLPGTETLAAAVAAVGAQFDPTWGGFGRAPKFPQSMSLEVLLRAAARDPSAGALAMVETTLDAMASGGMYDHLGGGFSRYSVDERWLVPHFEKMLYDNALLTRTYLHAWQVTGSARYLQVVQETVGYILRDLHHPGGGFLSSEDADSEGVEGKFYVWSADEVRAAVGDGDRAAAAMNWYGVAPGGNFEGSTILSRMADRGMLARPPEIEEARRRLFEARAQRVRPGLDDKVLTEWNGLMVAALAEAAVATGCAEWLDAATGAADFLLANLRDASGRWLRSWQEAAGARTLAFAADHAAMVDALTRLGEATGEARWTTEAVRTADDLVALFWDDADGGFFTTGHDGEQLVTRPKDLLDNATPSANSSAAAALLRLGALTGRDDFRARAEDVLRRVGPAAVQHPTSFGRLLEALELALAGPTEIVVAGARPDLVGAVQGRYLPDAVLAWGEPYDSPLWRDRPEGFAYVCRHYACQAPASDTAELTAALDRARPS